MRFGFGQCEENPSADSPQTNLEFANEADRRKKGRWGMKIRVKTLGMKVGVKTILGIKIIVVMVMLALAIAPVWGQVDTGSITGTVRDTSGAAVAGATVTAHNVNTSAERTVTSGDNGQYNITGVAPGIYELTGTSNGFAKFTSRVEVTVGAAVTVEPQLSVSNQTTTIEVVAAGGVEVNTQNQELSQIVNTQQMERLPSLTRNPYDFVQIAGNVSSGDRTASGFDQNTTNRGGGFALNAQP